MKSSRQRASDAETVEVRYRYPADEEPWEVSCDGIDEFEEREAHDEVRGLRSPHSARQAS